jgi:hypothetical protein
MTPALDAARDWHRAAKRVAWTVQVLGREYWDMLPADLPMFRRDRFKVDGAVLERQAVAADSELDDVAIVLLFAAFEATLRQKAADEVRAELTADPPRPAVVRGALRELLSAIRRGSAAKVLAAYKPHDPGLVEEVMTVRRHRNWVAHGRTGKLLSPTTPQRAYVCLDRFLNGLTPTPATA